MSLQKSLDMVEQVPLDSRSVIKDNVENVKYPFEGHIVYVENDKSFYAITSLDNEGEISSYCRIFQPMLDIVKQESTLETVLDKVFWHPSLILFYNSENGHRWKYNATTDGEFLVSEIYLGEDGYYYISRISVIYDKTNRSIEFVPETRKNTRINFIDSTDEDLTVIKNSNEEPLLRINGIGNTY